MWRSPRPHIDAGTVYRACISTAQPTRRFRLLALEETVVDAAARYVGTAATATLHDLKDCLEKKPDDETDRDELVTTYTVRMVSGAGRDYYDLLLNSAPHGRCPLCGDQRATTLDHQLPKKSYPLLAVVPDNLVPACSDCNKTKNNAVAAGSATQTLHPYFESADHARWLFARVRPAPRTPVQFFAQPGSEFTPIMQARILNHFAQFGLAARYASQVARELVAVEALLARLRNQSGPRAVVDALQDRAAGWVDFSPNCWQRSLFEALADSPDYVNGGLRAIMEP